MTGIPSAVTDDNEQSGEHDFDEEGVLVSPAKMQISYKDRGDDDLSRWKV